MNETEIKQGTQASGRPELERMDAEVCGRFFEAVTYLKEHGLIGGHRPFCERYGINVRNYYEQQKDHTRRIFRPAWLVYLIRDYGVSAEYLLFGSGPVMRPLDENSEKRAETVSEIQDLLQKLL